MVGGVTFVGLTLYATHARTAAPRNAAVLPELPVPADTTDAETTTVPYLLGDTRDELEQMQADLTAGRTPQRTHWVGLVGGEVVGIVSAGEGVAEWERAHFDNPEPPVSFNLDHIYTRRSSHGTGLGQTLLETALQDPHHPGRMRGAWLWILRENPRAEAFYRRNGFLDDELEVSCGASWFHRPMFRMWRPEPVDA